MSVKRFWPVIAWGALILLVSGLPGDAVMLEISIRDWLKADKLVHLLLFGIFTVFLLRAITAQYQYKKHRFRYVTLVLFIGTVFGFITEALQRYLFIGRSGNIFDLIADVLGCLAGVFVFEFFLSGRYQKN